jgi:mannose-6-phosphate isomerase-like protein (cupin superfamily)
MEIHDLKALLPTLPELRITPNTTFEEAMAAHRMLSTFNQCQLGVVRYEGEVPWERHPEGDELLYVLEGTIAVTILTATTAVDTILTAGALLVVPQGLWHRPRPQAIATLLFATPTQGNEHSFAVDPRLPIASTQISGG